MATLVFRPFLNMPDPACEPGDVLIAVEAISIEGGDLFGELH
jgi:hypothetical protein